jgi:predicted PurR-regulated permease PerM
MPSGLAVTASVILILGTLFGAFYLFGSQISAQVADLAQRLPLGWSRFEAAIAAQPWGDQLVDSLNSLTGYAERALDWAQTFAMGVAAALTGLLLVFVAGIYLALAPESARDGVLGLWPKDRRRRMRHVLNTCGRALKGWLRAQLLAMITVGLLCGLGLWLIGVPSAVALGVLTAILDFVPIVGPIAATIPAVLMAATVGWQEAALTLVLYFVVQQVESILIVPLAQKSVAKLPVILTVFSVIAFGGLFGPLGVLLSAPLALTLYVLVTMLYRQDVLKDEEAVAPGERG